MLKYSIGVFVLMFLSGFVGWYFGYINGAQNQVHFDAVARASLYEKALKSPVGSTSEMVNKFLFKQKCLLSSDFNYDTLTVHHPAHSDLLWYYKENLNRICTVESCGCVYDY